MTPRRALLSGLAAPALLRVAPAAAQFGGLDLRPARPDTKADDTVAGGYLREVLIRWGDRVTSDAPPFNPRQPTPEAAETQFGWDAVLAGLIPAPLSADGIPRAVLAVGHPTVDPAMAFPGGTDRPEIAAVLGGASILNLERVRLPGNGDRWVVVDGGYQSRRFTANTLCRAGGPATTALGGAVRGLLAVAGGTATPWGTLLLAEGEPEPWLNRLRALDPRFGNPRGFGWAVELDPADPTAVPTKRTALGRFGKGDAAATLTRDGRAAVYLTGRREGGHLYRFLSRSPAAEPDALDSGTLAVALVDGERLTWVDLPPGPDVVLEPAPLATRLGAAAFDQPSGLATDGRGRLYLAVRGQPGSDPARPGAILTVDATRADPATDTATIRTFLAGTPGRYVALNTAWPDHPDRLTLDATGRLWIGTDRGGRIGPSPDLLFGCETEGPGRGLPLPLYGAPRGGALGGCEMVPDGSALFAAVRTPGAEPGASWDRPGTLWPAFDAALPPRSAVLTLTRLRGGRVGG
ncbi:PhoX family phosphatase [Roseomonas sp. CCTCC AB2023176]|uniref:PhoX family protein n=1 Tax=Roseomonas sp. CCTCC AB2023176 TaxID=3342640 RepID=UPI0035E2F4A3